MRLAELAAMMKLCGAGGDGPDPSPAPADPATPELRLALARSLLAGAIRRYEETCAFAWEVDLAYPPLPEPTRPDEAEAAERRAWRKLKAEAADDFDSAELALAGRINNLYDALAPEGYRIVPDPDGAFVPRAVRLGSTTYFLADCPGRYEPETNIIAVVRDDAVIDLDAGKP